jgi:hypothetical protein
MSFSKTKKGNIDQVLKLLQDIPAEVAADDEKDTTATALVKEGHQLQATEAVNAMEAILQRIPSQHNECDKAGEPVVEVSATIFGSASTAGGNFGGSYSFSKKT